MYADLGLGSVLRLYLILINGGLTINRALGTAHTAGPLYHQLPDSTIMQIYKTFGQRK